jgi:hypothetical protein
MSTLPAIIIIILLLGVVESTGAVISEMDAFTISEIGQRPGKLTDRP